MHEQANFFICSLRQLCAMIVLYVKRINARLKRYNLQPYLGMRNDGDDGINSLEKLQQVHIHYFHYFKTFKAFNKCFAPKFIQGF
jgi:hypothetical protein